MSQPTLYVMHQGDETVARTRGADVIRGMAPDSVPLVVGSDIILELGPGRPAVVYVTMPNPGVVEQFREIMSRAGLVMMLMVDVIAPVWDPDAVIGSPEAREFWARPENVAGIRDACALAHVVTTPEPSWTSALMDMNPNVFITPDVTDDIATQEAFGLAWAEAYGVGLLECLRRYRTAGDPDR